jgi:hypothetical protein
MTDRAPSRRELHIDIGGMQQRARLGIRRAAAFLGLSERFLEEPLPRSLTLGRSIRRQFIADPLPEEIVAELRSSWRSWIIGNALRELDQFLSLMLDEAFDNVQAARIVAGDEPPEYQWRRIDRVTNVAQKHRAVLVAAGKFDGPHVEDQNCLLSLSNARNCLAHDLGRVTAKRVIDGVMRVQWLALQTVLRQGDKTTILDDVEVPFALDEDGPDGQVEIHFHIAERPFAEGELVDFTPDELLGICLFYNIVIDRVCCTLADHAREAGVQFPNEVSTKASPS